MPRHPLPSLACLAFITALLFHSGCAANPPKDIPRLNYLIAGGEPDLEDRYSSVVQVIIPKRGMCSGVLVNPRLVLTAAHCFCVPAPEHIAAGKVYSYRKGRDKGEVALSCGQTARLMSVLYKSSSPSPGGTSSEGTSSLIVPTIVDYKGPVRIEINEGYWFQTDSEADIIRSEMDLAAIHLAEPLLGVGIDGQLPSKEVQPEEFLVAVGYGASENTLAGTRHFGTTQVMALGMPDGADKVFSFGGHAVPLRTVSALRGDSGGPCFREAPDGRRWLIGIISRSKVAGDVLLTDVTSTFHHLEWINRQKALSEKSAKTR